ncbi:MAG: hypothetical protein U0Z44_16570 [Kouleothrix sp.]
MRRPRAAFKAIGQHLRFRLTDLAGGEELPADVAALDGVAVDEGQRQWRAALYVRGTTCEQEQLQDGSLYHRSRPGRSGSAGWAARR